MRQDDLKRIRMRRCRWKVVLLGPCSCRTRAASGQAIMSWNLGRGFAAVVSAQADFIAFCSISVFLASGSAVAPDGIEPVSDIIAENGPGCNLSVTKRSLSTAARRGFLLTEKGFTCSMAVVWTNNNDESLLFPAIGSQNTPIGAFWR
jgi:hypothetical protein